MKKYSFIIIALFSVLFLVSCGGNTENKQNENTTTDNTVDNSTTEPAKPVVLNTIPFSEFKILGTEKQYFKMVDGGQCEIVIGDNGYADITAEFELIKTYTGDARQYFVSMIAKDDKGKTVELSTTTNGEVRSDDSDGSRFLSFLTSEPGEKMVFSFSGAVTGQGFNADGPKTEEAIKKIKSFEVKSTKY
ncbi:hypothetical protein MASR1M45_29250 [Candidatus Kapaibacterium sp.]